MPFGIADIINTVMTATAVVVLFVIAGEFLLAADKGKIVGILLAGLAIQLMLSAGTDLGLIAKTATEAH